MKKTYTKTIFFILIFIPFSSFSQSTFSESVEEGGEYPIDKNDANHPCITLEQYKIIEKQCADNIKLLGLEKVGQKNVLTTAFIWPVRTANGINDCSYYYIGNYLDQDTTSPGIKDWNCGSVTYDGHKGTDICTFPYPFYKMDNNQVEVIAAAPGTIINRVDGNFDKNCAMDNSTANYIVVQHADGSCAMYWHMKKNSLTSKTIGQTVVAGEYLGVVGSSGSSSGPHLHFEVLSGITINTINDAYSGPCNTLNANSWWATQKPYTEPAIIEASVHPILAVFPSCPATETPNEDTCFTSGSSVKFYTFYRNETSGMVTNMRIINPDGTTFTSWTHNSNSNHLCSYWISTKTLPANAGTYIFEATYNGIICSKSFKIDCGITGILAVNKLSQFQVSPNPANSVLNIVGDGVDNGNYNVILKNIVGQVVSYDNIRIENNAVQKTFSISEWPRGIYFLKIENERGSIVRKIIKN
jgi:murein DD-endopeptidase MepM/ murein hydrolase activator NlpD